MGHLGSQYMAFTIGGLVGLALAMLVTGALREWKR
jgi:hypothetical protein